MATPVGWMWSEGEQAMAWWTGSEFTARAWWKGDHWVGSDPTVPLPQGLPPAPRRPASWATRPEQPGRIEYWDGQRWTGRVRELASPVTTRLGLGLLAVGTAVTLWGAWLVARADTGTAGMSPSEAFDYTCGTSDTPSHVSQGLGILWLPWSLLMMIVVAFVGLWSARAAGQHWMQVCSILGVVLLFVTFPLWLVVGTAMNCGL